MNQALFQHLLHGEVPLVLVELEQIKVNLKVLQKDIVQVIHGQNLLQKDQQKLKGVVQIVQIH